MKTIIQLNNFDHPITRIDARVKLIAALTILVMVAGCRSIAFPIVVTTFSIFLCLLIGVRLKLLLIRISQPLLIAVVVLLLKLFTGGGALIFSFSILGTTVSGYADGLREGAQIAVRIMGGVSVVTLVGFSTTFTDLMAALSWMRVPRGLIEVSLFAWRYLFVLFEDAMVVYNAQKNRLGYTGYRRSFRSFGTLAGAMVIKAFDNSQTITTAMIQRGYDGTMPLMRHKPFRFGEVAVALVVIAGFGIIWSYS